MRNASKLTLVATYGLRYKLFRTDKDGYYEISDDGIFLPCWAENDEVAIRRFANFIVVPTNCIHVA